MKWTIRCFVVVLLFGVAYSTSSNKNDIENIGQTVKEDSIVASQIKDNSLEDDSIVLEVVKFIRKIFSFDKDEPGKFKSSLYLHYCFTVSTQLF